MLAAEEEKARQEDAKNHGVGGAERGVGDAGQAIIEGIISTPEGLLAVAQHLEEEGNPNALLVMAAQDTAEDLNKALNCQNSRECTAAITMAVAGMNPAGKGSRVVGGVADKAEGVADATDNVNDVSRKVDGKFDSPDNIGTPIKQYKDGSFRTADGKFASKGGFPPPGTKSAKEYTQFLKDKGFDVVSDELTVKGPVGSRRYDAIIRTDSGELWGIEYKSGSATKTPEQKFNDMYINQFGADGVGKLAGEKVVGNITIYLP